MTDQVATTATEGTQQTPPPAAPPAIDIEKITQSASEAASRAVAEAMKGHKSLSAEDVAKIVSDEQKKVFKKLGGDEDKPQIHPLLASLVNDPVTTLSGTVEVAVNESEKRRDAKAQQERDAERAFHKILSKRTDITDSPRAEKVYNALFAQTDPNKPIQDRFQEALTEYDLALEEQGGGTAAERAAKAASVPSASAPGGNSTPKVKTQQEVDSDWLKDNVASWRKKRNK